MKKLIAVCATALIVATGTMTVSAQDYEVERGDTLWQIAQDNNVTVDKLMEVNNLKTTVIYPKQRLALNSSENDTYQVQKGDTLSEIGNAENVTVNELMGWNNLDSTLIIVGQELQVAQPALETQTQQTETTTQKRNEATEQQTSQATEDKQQSTASKQEQTTASKQEQRTEKANQSQQDQAAEQQTESKAETASKSNESANSSQEKANGRTLSVTATAYTAECDGCSGITYTGVNLNKDRDAKVIAVDPDVIPLGSKVYVEGYGYAKAADIGGAIQGNRVDLHVPTEQQALNYGVQNINVTIVE